MRTALCTREHGPRILEIINDVILTSTAVYDYRARTMEMIEAWFDAKEQASLPVIGLFDDSDELVAYGTYGPFRAWPAYKYSVEHSVYVERSNRGKGYGAVILGSIIDDVRGRGYHNLVAGIDATNEASIALHLRLGFRCCGTVEHAGFKFGRWIDLQLYQRLFDGVPADPVDG